MKEVWVVWHGCGYSHGYVPKYVEVFPSLVGAGHALEDRARMGAHYPQTFNYVNQEPISVYTPSSENAVMHVYLADPTGQSDPYPDRILTLTSNLRWKAF